MGEQRELMVPSDEGRVGLDTCAGKIHVEWDTQAAVTPLGQLPFFISFLKVSGLYDDFVASYPLSYTSPNAPAKRDVLGTLLMSILAGHHRYAHITLLRFDSVNPELRMIELKRHINELSRQLGQEPPFDLRFSEAP
jgi:hypothetical protein